MRGKPAEGCANRGRWSVWLVKKWIPGSKPLKASSGVVCNALLPQKKDNGIQL